MTLTKSRRVIIFAVISLALLMSSLDGTIVATALHAIKSGLHTSLSLAGWTITGYSLGLLVMLSLSGKLSERYGRRRVFVVSVIIFSLASLLCGLVTNIYLLIILRVIQAIGGAGFSPSATGIIVDNFGPMRDKAVGLFGSIFTVGALIGPVIGGIIVQYWSWHGVFLVNVPIGLILIPLCYAYIPNDTPKEKLDNTKLDLKGAIYLGLSILSLMLGLTILAKAKHSSSWIYLSLLIIFGLFMYVFARHIKRKNDPLILPKLIYGKNFLAVNGTNVIYGGLVAGLVALVPTYAVIRYGMSALNSGTLLASEAVGAIIFSSLGAFLLRKTGYKIPIYLGTTAVIIGMLMLALSPYKLTPYSWLALSAGIIGVGAGFLSPASRNAGLQLVPEHASQLAALRTTGMQTGTILGVSIATAIIDHSTTPGAIQATIYFIFALILLIFLPIIHKIPEHHGAW